MPKKSHPQTSKKHIQPAVDNLREALQSLPTRKAIGSIDRRSVKRSKHIVKELGKEFSDQEMAGALEISRQKYTYLKGQIKRGKLSNSTLNNLLDQAREKILSSSGRPKDETGLYMSDRPVNGKSKFRIDYTVMDQDYIEKNIRWAQNIKPGGFASKQSALNWYGGVTGGKEYFKIVKGRTGRWLIYDTRTPSEKSRKGEVSGETRAQKIIERDQIF